jgi:hypothetical protein
MYPRISDMCTLHLIYEESIFAASDFFLNIFLSSDLSPHIPVSQAHEYGVELFEWRSEADDKHTIQVDLARHSLHAFSEGQLYSQPPLMNFILSVYSFPPSEIFRSAPYPYTLHSFSHLAFLACALCTLFPLASI